MATSDRGCPRCGAPVPGGAKFCAACGYATARLQPGQTLDGKYEILEKIAEGGMGEVYKARHIHLDEIRIIKVTKPDPLGEGSEPRRFQEEARMATLVRHPNVAALYDFSRLPEGSFYMVWEFIDGITLEQWLGRYGPLPASRALDVARQVMAGLAQIHAQGIVHRDLSPDNIMLKETRDGRLLAKIIDLGIAKRVAAESVRMTGTGMFLGKLKYCSPEQAGSLPSGVSVDGRSDLYSFGVVLYEMLMGRPPFESQTPEGYLGKHLHAPPPPLDTTRLPAKIGPALAGIVSRALEKERGRRFPDAQEFGDALARVEAVARDQTDSLPTAVMEVEASRFPYAWILGTFIVLTLAAGIFILNLRREPAEAPASLTATEPPDTEPRPTPTASPDSVVLEPRILERPTSPEENGPSPTEPARMTPAAEPTRPPPATAPTVPLISESRPGLASPPGGALTADYVKTSVELWRRSPIDRRARRANDVARMANLWVESHPGDPLAGRLREELPQAFKRDSLNALDNAQPVMARLFYLAYAALTFAPDDPELAQRLNAAPPPGKRPGGGSRQRRPRDTDGG